VLHHFGLELHVLVPNCLQQMAIFVALYEGYLKVEPNFNLFLYFFKAAVSA
jgi:hypothetical protein